MTNVCKTAQSGKVGETSSKYGMPNGGELFEADLKRHEERHNFLWDEFVSFMKSHDATPDEFRGIFVRYYEEFIKGAADYDYSGKACVDEGT